MLVYNTNMNFSCLQPLANVAFKHNDGLKYHRIISSPVTGVINYLQTLCIKNIDIPINSTPLRQKESIL